MCIVFHGRIGSQEEKQKAGGGIRRWKNLQFVQIYISANLFKYILKKWLKCICLQIVQIYICATFFRGSADFLVALAFCALNLSQFDTKLENI